MGIVNFLPFSFNRALRKILLRVEGEFRASAWEDEEDEILLSWKFFRNTAAWRLNDSKETGSSYQHGYCYRYFLIALCCLRWIVSEASTSSARPRLNFQCTIRNEVSPPSNRNKCARVLNLMHSNDPLPSHPRLDRRDHFLPSRFFSSYQYLSSVHSSKRRCLTGMTGRRKKEKKNGKKSRPIDLFPLLDDTIASFRVFNFHFTSKTIFFRSARLREQLSTRNHRGNVNVAKKE